MANQTPVSEDRIPVSEDHISAKPRRVSDTGQSLGEAAFGARIAELDEALAERERVIRTQLSQLAIERQATKNALQAHDLLKAIVDEQAQANDAALAVLAAREQGSLLAYEVLEGVVADVSDAEVVVRFDTGDDLVEQAYDRDQFNLGKVPALGNRLAVYVHLALLPLSLAEPGSENEGDTHETRPRKHVITGDHRF